MGLGDGPVGGGREPVGERRVDDSLGACWLGYAVKLVAVGT